MKIIRWILVVIFAVEGLTKLVGFKFQVDFFSSSGYSLWFMYVIGILELAGAIGLLLPKFRKYANVGLFGILIGAFYTHIFVRHDSIMMTGLAIVATILLTLHLRSILKSRNH